MEIKDVINISLARKLYNSGDKDLVNLALKVYDAKEIDTPDYNVIIENYSHSNQYNDMMRKQKIITILAAIAYKFYGKNKDYRNESDEFCERWIVITSEHGYISVRPAVTRIGDVCFASKDDAETAIRYLTIYQADGLI